MKKSKIIISMFSLLFATGLYAQTQFTGIGGGRTNLSFYQDQTKQPSPELTADVFFQGQIGFSDNMWLHADFSLNTTNILKNSLLRSTPSTFQLDEISLTHRAKLDTVSNYLSFYTGSIDPIGSDVFLRRQFGLKNITSRLTNNWFAESGKLLYPNFGAGVSDVLQLSTPHAIGAYFYVNQETSEKLDYLVLNTDIRYACTLPYFTMDLATGFGAPIKNNYKSEDVIMVIDSIFWHAGLTTLWGSAYTQSLYFQFGVYNAEYSKKTKKLSITNNNLYFLLEPRFITKSMNYHFSFWSVPESSTTNMIFLNDTLGMALNVFSDNTEYQSNAVKAGCTVSLSLKGKSFIDIFDFTSLFKSQMNIYVTPYAGIKIFRGDLNACLKTNLTGLFSKENKWYEAVTFIAGYKTAF